MSRANPSRGTFLLSEERTKRFTLRLDKQDEDGERSVTALFATFNVVDLDGDVTEPGAFGKQSVLMGAYNHNPGMLPPGKGATYEEDDAALFKGRFFTTSSGTEHYTTIKEAGGTMEWSYRFFVEDGGFETRDGENVFIIRKAKVTHVAPVEAGAGIGTRTVDIKCVDCDAKANRAPNSFSLEALRTASGLTAKNGSIDYTKLAETIATAVAAALPSPSINYNGEVYDQAKFDELVENAAKALQEKQGCPDGCRGSSGEGGCGGCGQAGQKGATLGNLLRELRDERELSNEDLANAAGVSTSTMGQILAGSIDCPPIERLEGLADRLNVSRQRLVTAAESDGCDYSSDSSRHDDVDLKGENLGGMIRNLRDARGLSNDDLANAAGISVSTIGQILGGTIKCPRLAQMQALARRLNVSLSRLVSAAERDGCESMDGKALEDAVPEDTTADNRNHDRAAG